MDKSRTPEMPPWMPDEVAHAGPEHLDDGYTAADYAEHIRTEHSTFRWLLEPMLTAAGFEIAEVSYERRLYAAYTCVMAGGG